MRRGPGLPPGALWAPRARPAPVWAPRSPRGQHRGSPFPLRAPLSYSSVRDRWPWPLLASAASSPGPDAGPDPPALPEEVRDSSDGGRGSGVHPGATGSDGLPAGKLRPAGACWPRRSRSGLRTPSPLPCHLPFLSARHRPGSGGPWTGRRPVPRAHGRAAESRPGLSPLLRCDPH